jgi:hypothetical protein
MYTIILIFLPMPGFKIPKISEFTPGCLELPQQMRDFLCVESGYIVLLDPGGVFFDVIRKAGQEILRVLDVSQHSLIGMHPFEEGFWIIDQQWVDDFDQVAEFLE